MNKKDTETLKGEIYGIPHGCPFPENPELLFVEDKTFLICPTCQEKRLIGQMESDIDRIKLRSIWGKMG
jgi:hypothetical protein